MLLSWWRSGCAAVVLSMAMTIHGARVDEDLLPMVSAQLGFNSYWGSPFYANAMLTNGAWWAAPALLTIT